MSGEAEAAQARAPTAASSSKLLADPHTMAQIYDMADDGPQVSSSKSSTSNDLSGRGASKRKVTMLKFGRRQTMSHDLAPSDSSPSKSSQPSDAPAAEACPRANN
jgi:hypothetical protein